MEVRAERDVKSVWLAEWNMMSDEGKNDAGRRI